VIDDAARPELRDREEARPSQELLADMTSTAAREERRQWEPREVVPRQEPLAREVAVAVEVRVMLLADLKQ
jgi:hypothetical protein